MALLDQLRLLDRALRDVRVREALRTGDRGGRRLARFAGSVAPADLAVLRAVDARRFEAVAQRQAELIRDRWWTPRFPGILLGTAKALEGTTRDVALGALASPAYDRREGADDTGSALLGYVTGREDRTNDPEWLADLVAYEYLISVGLPRRAKNQPVDAALEQRVFPEGTRFLEAPTKKARAADLVPARKAVLLPLEFPVSQIREALLAGQEVDAEVETEPHVLVFVIEADAANEHPFPARAHDVLDMLIAAPLEGRKLLEAFEPFDRVEVFTVLEALHTAGVVAGTLPPRPEPVERPADEDEVPAKGKGKGKGKADAKGKAPAAAKGKAPAPAAGKGAKAPAPAAAKGAKAPAAAAKGGAKPPAPAAKAPAPAKGKAPAPAKGQVKSAAKAPAPAKAPAVGKPPAKAAATKAPTKGKPAKAPAKAAAGAKKSAARRR